jgi:hypothetical protein
MRAFICRTPDVDAEDAVRLIDLLQNQHGPIDFVNGEVVDIETVDTGERVELEWVEAFGVMRDARTRIQALPEDALFLLTGIPNQFDYFAFSEAAGTGSGNHCLMVGEWEHFSVDGFIHPALHIIASNLIQGWMHESMDAWSDWAHQEPRGCISDFCQNKSEILLRLRTADLCDSCVDDFNEAIENGKISAAAFHQCMQLVELARTKLCFRKRMKAAPMVSPLVVKGKRMQIWLTKFKRELNIGRGIPKCLYLLYLKHPEGIPYKRLDEHIEELIAIHKRVSGNRTVDEVRADFNRLFQADENATGEYASRNQQISRLRSSLKRELGGTVLSHYIWDSDAEIKAIPIASQKGMVTWEVD